MRLETLKLADLIPYVNNPRKNDDAVNAVAESIRQCTYITPIIVDENRVIIAGHTRYKALKALGIEEAPCLICDGLTEEQKKPLATFQYHQGKWYLRNERANGMKNLNDNTPIAVGSAVELRDNVKIRLGDENSRMAYVQMANK